MNQIIMRVRGWSAGNVGEVRALLDGGSCHIDWGDGNNFVYKADGQELHVKHEYPEKDVETEINFVIRIYSDSDNIIGIYAECGDLMIEDIDISGCQSLRYFESLSACTEFDLRANPGITKVKLVGDYDGIADFSNSLELKELSISWCFACSDAYQLFDLDLSKCTKLEKFKCFAILTPIRIKLPKYFPLKEFTYGESINSCFSRQQLKKIVKIIEHNNGKILKDNLWGFPHSEVFLQPESKNMCLDTPVPMQAHIKMTIATSGHGYLACIVLLLDGGSCDIDWGDGQTSTLHAEATEWMFGMHIYSRKCMSRQVVITSGTGNIIGMITENSPSCRADVDAIDLSGCQSLRYFGANYISDLDININPEIRIIDLFNIYCKSLDFLNCAELEHLYIRSGIGGGQKAQSLDLTKCRHLQSLALVCPDLSDIIIDENSSLELLAYKFTPLNESTIRNLQQVIKRNGGELIELNQDDSLSDMMMYKYREESKADTTTTEDKNEAKDD